MSYNYYNLNNCRICNSKSLKKCFSLSNIPIPEKYLRNKIAAIKLPRFPLTILICTKCKHIQQKEIINQKKLWDNYTYFSGQTSAIEKHFNDVSKLILKRIKVTKNDLVIDIGSNDGTLLKFFKKKSKVLGIDPARTVAKYAIKKNKIQTLIKFFDDSSSDLILQRYQCPKIITAFNVFAHTPSMASLVKNIKKILHPNGLFVFEAQYVGDILKNNILGTFFHEHISHHSVQSLKKLFQIHDLKIVDIKRVKIQKGSILGMVSHKNNSIKIDRSVNTFIKNEKKNKINTKNSLIDFKRKIEKTKIDAINLIKKFNYISGFGAARSGPTLLRNFNLENKINLIFDDHKMKINRYTPSSGIKILPSKNLTKIMPDLTIILAYLHNKKIIIKNISYLKKGGTFMILFPKPKLITNSNYKKFLNV
jgi:2-polyprenyl-3-methyl-5-hydroxy-6-metoxy-1,4-benzoquinol methylase